MPHEFGNGVASFVLTSRVLPRKRFHLLDDGSIVCSCTRPEIRHCIWQRAQVDHT